MKPYKQRAHLRLFSPFCIASVDTGRSGFQIFTIMSGTQVVRTEDLSGPVGAIWNAKVVYNSQISAWLSSLDWVCLLFEMFVIFLENHHLIKIFLFATWS
jgi:hypothetical protein